MCFKICLFPAHINWEYKINLSLVILGKKAGDVLLAHVECVLLFHSSWCSVVRKASSVLATIIYFSTRSLKGAFDVHISLLHKRNYQVSSNEEKVQGRSPEVKYIHCFPFISTCVFLVVILGRCWPGCRTANLKRMSNIQLPDSIHLESNVN